MFFNQFKKSALALALGLGLVQAAQAQTANGSLVYSGAVTANTCILYVEERGNLGNTTGNARPGLTLNIDFGNITPPATVSAIGTALGTSRSINLLAAVPGPEGGVCTASGLAGDKTSFNVMMQLNATDIVSLNSQTYRVNDTPTASGGTDAVLALQRGTTVTTTTPMNLQPSVAGSTTQGTLVGATAAAISSAGLVLTAQLATRAAALPTAGTFTALIPLFVVYQ
jgi:hypothetical protein